MIFDISVTESPSEDLEDKNLSWLFNFKLDDLPHLSPEAKRRQLPKTNELILDSTPIEEDDLNVAENVTNENSTAKV